MTLTSTLVGGECSAVNHRLFNVGHHAPGTHSKGAWMGPRTGLDTVEERRTLLLPGSVVRWGTMLQTGRLPVLESRSKWIFFINLPNPSSRTMALWLNQPLTEMSTRYLPGGKKRPACRADKLAAICEPNVWNVGVSTSRNPNGLPPWPVTWIT
jgi:hypothetical protein